MPEMNNMKVGNDVYEVADPKSRGVSLTWAQYQALSYEEQHNGTAYYITDMDAIYPVDHELNANSSNAVANDIVTPHILAMENVLGAKNFLPYPYTDTTKTVSGITFTDNGDGTVTINPGTATANVYFNLVNDESTHTGMIVKNVLKPLQYAINTGIAVAGVTIDIYIPSYISKQVATEDVFSITKSVLDSPLFVYITIVNGTTISEPITIKPMIRPAGTDPTYVPYAMTNEQLTERVNEIMCSSSIEKFGGFLNSAGSYTDLWAYYVAGIPVSENSHIEVLNPANNANVYSAFYDNSNQLIAGSLIQHPISGTITATVPLGARVMRVTMYNNSGAPRLRIS